MKIQELKEELGIKDKDIAKFFGLKPKSYSGSSAKERYEQTFIKIYEFLKSKHNSLQTFKDMDLMPVGKFEGQPISEVPVSEFQYLIDQCIITTFKFGSVYRYAKRRIEEHNNELRDLFIEQMLTLGAEESKCTSPVEIDNVKKRALSTYKSYIYNVKHGVI